MSGFGGNGLERTYNVNPCDIRIAYIDEDGFRGREFRKKATENVRTMNQKFCCSSDKPKKKPKKIGKSNRSHRKIRYLRYEC